MTSSPRSTTVPESGSAGASRPLVYVYAVAGDQGRPARAASWTRGLGSRTRLLTAGGLAALVCDVPASDFSSDALAERLEDLETLEGMARAHHETIAAAARTTTVLPLRFATVYEDEARVCAMLTERADEFRTALARLDGHVELGVKVYAEPGAVAPEAGGAEASGSPGRAYLRRRQAQRHAHRDVHRAAGLVAARCGEAADRFARAGVVHRLQQGVLAEAAGENVFNGAYLVSRDEAAGFVAALEALDRTEPGTRVVVSGPWVPYSFTEWARTDDGRRDG
ncbi:GvpL/GvpF family gas vesicle protein [[Kitasatospora] papulosa]|uniref:GvpL/GvpF family gas vesicle protein n=1 Tax=Streptomyces TaxID=1883 RepID=UPI0023B1DDC7|nr:GvpL/GvpF family gas vesicle protein [Streptomyces sp. KA12]MDF0372612.1 GvpL/GvpF family gas vesicle protein [Streptomyces sp. KA12]